MGSKGFYIKAVFMGCWQALIWRKCGIFLEQQTKNTIFPLVVRQYSGSAPAKLRQYSGSTPAKLLQNSGSHSCKTPAGCLGATKN